MRKALKLYSEFREETPKRGRRIQFKMPKVVMVMGTLHALEYDTTIAGRTKKFRHKFNAGSKPTLCVTGDGQLFIVEGRYHVTVQDGYRGIVDIDGRGRELDDDGSLLT